MTKKKIKITPTKILDTKKGVLVWWLRAAKLTTFAVVDNIATNTIDDRAPSLTQLNSQQTLSVCSLYSFCDKIHCRIARMHHK